jgi:hypothetical protein
MTALGMLSVPLIALLGARLARHEDRPIRLRGALEGGQGRDPAGRSAGQRVPEPLRAGNRVVLVAARSEAERRRRARAGVFPSR